MQDQVGRTDSQGLLGDCLSAISFAARDADGRLTIWAKGPRCAVRLRERFGPAAKVLMTDRDRLERASTLARMSAAFGTGEIIHDPSGVATRAGAVVRLVKSLRAQLGRTLHLALFDVERRRVSLVLRRPRRADASQVNAVLADAQVALARAASDSEQIFSVLLTFSAPRGRFVPVDAVSLRRVRASRLLGRLRKALAAGAAVAAAAAHPVAAQQAAGLVGAQGGTADGKGSYAAEGLIAFSNQPIGFQADGMALRRDDLTAGELGFHLFRRDPNSGLIGLTTRWNDLGPGERWQIGVEAERYLGRTTLVGEIGYENGLNDEGGVYGNAGFGFYPNDATSLYFVAGYTLDEPIAQASFEVQPAREAMPGLSLFADGGVGVNGEAFVTAGLRFTFGSGASLIDRDRREIVRRRINPLALALDSQS